MMRTRKCMPEYAAKWDQGRMKSASVGEGGGEAAAGERGVCVCKGRGGGYIWDLSEGRFWPPLGNLVLHESTHGTHPLFGEKARRFPLL
jgi:hypothetical protein